MGGASSHDNAQVTGIENAMKIMYEADTLKLAPSDSTFLFACRVCINVADSI